MAGIPAWNKTITHPPPPPHGEQIVTDSSHLVIFIYCTVLKLLDLYLFVHMHTPVYFQKHSNPHFDTTNRWVVDRILEATPGVEYEDALIY